LTCCFERVPQFLDRQVPHPGRIVREVGALLRGRKQVATFALDTEIRFTGAAARAAFADELTRAVTALVAKHHVAEGSPARTGSSSPPIRSRRSRSDRARRRPLVNLARGRGSRNAAGGEGGDRDRPGHQRVVCALGGPCCQIRVHAALVQILCRCVVRVLSGGFPVSQAS